MKFKSLEIVLLIAIFLVLGGVLITALVGP